MDPHKHNHTCLKVHFSWRFTSTSPLARQGLGLILFQFRGSSETKNGPLMVRRATKRSEGQLARDGLSLLIVVY